MHYGAKSFSKNGEDTVRIIDPAVKVTLGQRSALSDTDAKQLALLYKCPTGIVLFSEDCPLTDFYEVMLEYPH